MGLVAVTVGGLEYVTTVAVSCTNALIQAEDLEDLLDLDEPTSAIEWEADAVVDSKVPAASPAAAERP